MILAGTLMLPEGPTRVRLAGGWLRVEGGRIAEVHEGDRSPTPDLGGDERVIVPGFVDAHVHLPQFDAIGADGLTLLDWLERVIYPAEARWADADFAAERTGRAIARMISHGTTAFAAFATVHQDAAHRAGRMALESGVRCAIGQVLMDQQAPAEFCRPVNQLINEVRRTLATEPSDRVAFAVAPRFAIACSGRLLEAAGRLARETGAMVQTHLAETPQEARHVRELHGKPYTQVYHDAGLLSRRSVLGHGIWLAEEDRALLASREAIIAHCPTANTFLQSGVMDRAAHHAAGVRVALGSDVAGGPDVSMVPVVRAMVEAAKTLAPLRSREGWGAGVPVGGAARCPGDPSPASAQGGGAIPSAAECFAQITHVNADLLGWPRTSRLTAGSEADLLIVQPDVPWRSAPDPLGMLLYAWDGRWIEQVIVSGRMM